MIDSNEPAVSGLGSNLDCWDVNITSVSSENWDVNITSVSFEGNLNPDLHINQ